MLQGVFKTLPRSWSHLAQGGVVFLKQREMGKVFPYPSKTAELGVGGHGYSWISTDTRDVGLIYFRKDIPSLKLTSRTWKFMNPKMKFPCGARPILRCEVFVSGRVYLYTYAHYLFWNGWNLEWGVDLMARRSNPKHLKVGNIIRNELLLDLR